MHIFVINLEKSLDRRARMAEQLNALNLAHQFFPAVNGYALDLAKHPAYAGTLRKLCFGRDFTPGYFGCLLSHRAVYQHMVDQDIEEALILEDDAILNPDLPQVLDIITKLDAPWEMIRFLGSEKVYRNSRDLLPLYKDFRLTRPLLTPGGACGYILKKSAAKKLLRVMQKNFLANDVILGHIWLTRVNVYAVKPSPVYEDMTLESTIGMERFNKKIQLQGWLRYAYPITRGLYKFLDLIAKRIYICTSYFYDKKLKKNYLEKQSSI
jgi:glycosyl transferase family 25